MRSGFMMLLGAGILFAGSILSTYGTAVSYGTTNVKIMAFSVQDAVNKAVDSNIVFMSEGVFYEQVVVSNKDLTFEGGWDTNLLIRTGGYTAIDGGGAGLCLYFNRSSSRLDRVNLVHGSGIWGGGALLKENSWVEFIDSSLSSNGSIFAGGGLYVDGGSYAKLTGSSRVFTNTAVSVGVGAWGGGIYVESSGRVDLVHEDADVFGNAVIDGNGGGIYVSDGAYLRLFQSDVFNNVAVSGPVSIASAGGGIGAGAAFFEAGDGAEIYGNRADWGGGLALIASTAVLGRARSGDVRVRGNMANVRGGGILAINAMVSTAGLSVETNTAVQDGGGMCLGNGQWMGDTNGLSLRANQAGGNGGGLYAEGPVMLLIGAQIGAPGGGNTAGGMGGGVFLTNGVLMVRDSAVIGNRATNSSGGGVAVVNSYVAFNYMNPYPENGTQIVFEANTASEIDGCGGGLFLSDMSYTSWVWQCEFRSNTAYRGGGLYLKQAPAFVMDCDFVRNSARDEGGGVDMQYSGSFFNECDFDENVSHQSGGAIFDYRGSMFVSDSRFRNNVASNTGGAVGCLFSTSVWFYTAGLSFYSATNGWPLLFEGNLAEKAYGGAFYVAGCPQFIMERAAVLSNRAAYVGGVMLYDTVARLEHCLVAGQSDYGVYLWTATGTLLRCSMVSNGYAGLLLEDGEAFVSNCVIWGHAYYPCQTNNNTRLTVNYCDIQGGWPGNNIDADPRLFINGHLQYESPCRDAGSPSPPYDYDVDGDYPIGNWDIGCDEFLDTDGDHLPDIVETGTGIRRSDIDQGSYPNNPESDGDEVPDGDEWLADTDPTDSNSYLRVTRMSRTAGQWQVQWKGGVQAWQCVEGTTNLLNPTAWTTLFTNVPPTLVDDQTLIPFGATPGVFRIRAFR